MDARLEPALALDPESAALIAAARAAGFPPVSTLTADEARHYANLRFALAAAAEPEAVAQVADIRIDGDATQMAARIYNPAAASSRPTIVYFHGGGWVVGSLDSHDALCRALANEVGAVVLSVDYRLAPDVRFPAPAEDAYAATVWAATNVAQLGGDRSRIIVAGDSAGGNLAAAAALIARDYGGPSIAAQVLIYPVTDAYFETGSYREYAEGYNLRREDMMWYWRQYLLSPADGDNSYASPLRDMNLAGLPPAVVVTAGFDPLRDEGEAYAAAMNVAGVPVVLRRYPGSIHGFMRSPRALAAGRLALSEIVDALTVFGVKR